MFGWMGKILKVDLTAKIVEDFPIPAEWWEQYLGGRGLGVKIYSGLCTPDVDPLSPENALIFHFGGRAAGRPGAGKRPASPSKSSR